MLRLLKYTMSVWLCFLMFFVCFFRVGGWLISQHYYFLSNTAHFFFFFFFLDSCLLLWRALRVVPEVTIKIPAVSVVCQRGCVVAFPTDCFVCVCVGGGGWGGANISFLCYHYSILINFFIKPFKKKCWVNLHFSNKTDSPTYRN